jgi:hypothetical protein
MININKVMIRPILIKFNDIFLYFMFLDSDFNMIFDSYTFFYFQNIF